VTIDERLEALKHSLELLARLHADAGERQTAAEERHDREMEDIRREGRAMRADMRRARSMCVREARNERRRAWESDGMIAQLAAAQLVTEEKLQRLIDSTGSGGNGNPRP
jgi:hypothetical protein